MCQTEEFRKMPRKVVFISNAHRTCAISNQKVGNGEPIIWDYHVVLLAQGKIWDMDTLLSFPCGISRYLTQSFLKNTFEKYLPKFRLIDADDFIDVFASDRRHMLDDNGIPIHPPPPWPAIHPERGSNIYDFINMERRGLGKILNLEQFGKLK